MSETITNVLCGIYFVVVVGGFMWFIWPTEARKKKLQQRLAKQPQPKTHSGNALLETIIVPIVMTIVGCKMAAPIHDFVVKLFHQ